MDDYLKFKYELYSLNATKVVGVFAAVGIKTASCCSDLCHLVHTLGTEKWAFSLKRYAPNLQSPKH